MKLVDKVVQLSVTPKDICEQAIAADLTDCVVMGWDKDEQAWFGTTMSGGAEVVWMIEQFKYSIITGNGE